MKMPKLDLTRTSDILEVLGKDPASVLDKVKEEQGREFMKLLAVLGIANFEAVRGFLVCYLLIQETMEIAELEKLVK